MHLEKNQKWIFDATASGVLTTEMRKAFDTNGVLILKDFTPHEACDALQKRMSEILVDFKAQGKATRICAPDLREGNFEGLSSENLAKFRRTSTSNSRNLTRSATKKHQNNFVKVRRTEHYISPTKTNQYIKNRYFLNSAGNIGFFFEEEAFDASGKLIADFELSLNKVSHALHDKDPVFEDFSYQPKIKSLLLSLGYLQPQLVQSMYIFKQPRIGGEVGYHQDATYLYAEPMPPVGLWFALEDATTENGCLWGFPGLHNEPLRVRFKREGKEFQHQVIDTTPWDEAQAIPLPASKGSVVILHGYFPHGSYPNRSAFSRHAYTLHAIEASSCYPAENWLQRPKDFPFRLM